MKFIDPQRRNPFANPFLRLALHAFASVLALFALHAVLTQGMHLQFWLAIAALTGLEVTWVYFALRR